MLLCRRAIQPCKGLWTVPAGFLEMGESTAAGAARETWEEANARVEVRTASAMSPLEVRAADLALLSPVPREESLAHAMVYPSDSQAQALQCWRLRPLTQRSCVAPPGTARL